MTETGKETTKDSRREIKGARLGEYLQSKFKNCSVDADCSLTATLIRQIRAKFLAQIKQGGKDGRFDKRKKEKAYAMD